MKTKDNEFQSMLCKLYMAMILCVLPLYTQGTYVQLGDTKYLLFRNVSFICVGLWLAAALICSVQKIFVGKKGADQVQMEDGLHKRVRVWSIMDACMAAYGGSVLWSAALSSYERTAWLGYRDWYMGAVSQLLFVAIYFMVSRCCDNSSILIYLGEGTMLAVCVIAFLQRLGIDTLGLHKMFNKVDWEYKHMLSTVGNINWLCGYLSVVIVFSVSAYLYSREAWKKAGHYLASVAGLVLLCIQGSDIGWVLCAMCIGICIVWGWNNIVFLQRSLLLAAGTVLCLPCLAGLALHRGSIQTMPADGNVYERISWTGWWVVFAVLLLMLGLLKWAQGRKSTRREANLPEKNTKTELFGKRAKTEAEALGRSTQAEAELPGRGAKYEIQMSGGSAMAGEETVRKKLPAGSVRYPVLRLGICLTVCVFLFIMVAGKVSLPEDFWQEGRGALWKLAWRGFLDADILQKLIGAGPDCFAEYLHNGFQTATVIHRNGYWAGATFANAHNEWLNQLVNIGILGAFCYMSIFVTAIKRYRGMLLGVLAVGLYFVNSLVSFQQVMNAPFLFLVLGLCENKRSCQNTIDFFSGAC